MNRYGKRCVLYPRVSTEMQVDGYSLEGQKNMLTRFADREEMIVVDTYEDAGKSGKSIEGRPAFQKMLRDIEDGLDIDYILVYKLSRFGRNAADILNSLELVQSYGVNLICIEEGIDSSQTSGKLLISVLSAVAEIERENIIEQTMNGRREKARQGGWNGGFAPYGYTLEDNKLMIEETEAVAIRKIFELYTSSEIGLGGIANQLNLQGIRKIPRQNGTLEDWTGHFIKLILDNPVYCGKIAYGRRTKEKVKGTKNDYQMKRNDDYILTEGQHKGIVSEEVWEKAHAKRLRTGVKQPSKIGRDRVHLLSGLLKCPVCGSPMYTNKHAWTNKDGTYKEIYYYVCSRNRMVRGKHCEYKAMLKKTDIEPMVIEAIREIVRNEEYAQAIKKRIGVQIDTKAVDKELEGYQAKLKEVDLNKTRLEREIDSLPADAKYRERKLHDMTLRLDSLYDVIVELEEKIEDARLRRDAIKQQAITLENIYKIMVNFDCVYNIINDEEKRNVVTALIKEIEIYRNDESEYPLKRIGLNFPVFKDGGEVTELLWDKGNTVEPCNLLYITIVQIEKIQGKHNNDQKNDFFQPGQHFLCILKLCFNNIVNEVNFNMFAHPNGIGATHKACPDEQITAKLFCPCRRNTDKVACQHLPRHDRCQDDHGNRHQQKLNFADDIIDFKKSTCKLSITIHEMPSLLPSLNLNRYGNNGYSIPPAPAFPIISCRRSRSSCQYSGDTLRDNRRKPLPTSQKPPSSAQPETLRQDSLP